MGVLEDMRAQIDALEARLAQAETRLSRVENTAGISRDDAARLLGIGVRTLDGYIAVGGPYFDAELAACTYLVKGRRLFHPHKLEAYRLERCGKARPARGRSARSQDCSSTPPLPRGS